MSEEESVSYTAELASATNAAVICSVYSNHNSQVYKAIINNRAVAIKVGLRKNKIQNINRETALLKKLRHPNLVKYISDGKFRTNEGKTMRYLVEEFVDGQTLDILLDHKRTLPWPTAVDYLTQMCSFLKEFHETGRMYIDLKPNNIMIDHQGRLKFIDLGAVQKQPYTLSEEAIGVVQYMSPDWKQTPEQESIVVDSRADIYSLGIILYEMITGNVPFWNEIMRAMDTNIPGNAWNVTVFQHLNKPKPLLPNVPERLNRIYTKLMEPVLSLRYQKLEEVLEDLDRL